MLVLTSVLVGERLFPFIGPFRQEQKYKGRKLSLELSIAKACSTRMKAIFVIESNLGDVN